MSKRRDLVFVSWSTCLHNVVLCLTVMSIVVLLMVYYNPLENGWRHTWYMILCCVLWIVNFAKCVFVKWEEIFFPSFTSTLLVLYMQIDFLTCYCVVEACYGIVLYTFGLRSFMMLQYVDLLRKWKKPLNGFVQLIINILLAKLYAAFAVKAGLKWCMVLCFCCVIFEWIPIPSSCVYLHTPLFGIVCLGAITMMHWISLFLLWSYTLVVVFLFYLH